MSDIAYQAESIISLIAENGGAICHIPRIMIQHTSWNLKTQLLDQMREVLTKESLPGSYYPGTKERQQLFVKSHPEAEIFGIKNESQPPWTLITGLNPKNSDDICFKTESFFGYLAETEIEAPNIASFIDRAVEFANSILWGTLSALIFVHPSSLKNVAVAGAIERAIRNLQYGMVGVNYSAAAIWASGASPWGPFPGSDIYDIQSGCGFGHNALMLSHVQKIVSKAPFRSKTKPLLLITHGKANAKVMKRMFDFELSPSVWKVPGMMFQALKG